MKKRGWRIRNSSLDLACLHSTLRVNTRMLVKIGFVGVKGRAPHLRILVDVDVRYGDDRGVICDMEEDWVERKREICDW